MSVKDAEIPPQVLKGIAKGIVDFILAEAKRRNEAQAEELKRNSTALEGGEDKCKF